MIWPFLIAGLGCLYFCCLGFGQNFPSQNARSLDQALQLARAHRYTEAAAALRGVSPPGDTQQRIAFFRLRASIKSGLGHSQQAAADMEMAARLAPHDVDLQAAAGLARVRAQVEAHVSPAATLENLRSLALDPQRKLEVSLRTAEILSRANLFGEAAREFEEANRLAPARADILFNLGLARYRNGEWDAALRSVEQAKALADSGSVESLLGDIHEKRGDALAAVHSYQAAVALEPNLEQHRLTLATELLKHQTFDAAIVVLEQATSLFPQSARMRILLGISYYLVDRSPDAVRVLLEAAKLDPKDEVAARYLGEITLQDSAVPNPAAIRQICAFADAHPSSKDTNALCGGVLLRAVQEGGDDSRMPEILRRLRQAVLVAPQEPVARCELGKAFERSQQWQQARIHLEKCVQLDANSPEGHYRLARVYRRLGLTLLANQQTALQKQAAQRQSEESTRRTKTVTRFLVLFEH